MSAPVLIRGGRVIDPRHRRDECCDVMLRDGRVAAVGTGLAQADAKVIDAGGKLVVPGLIDLHVHFREPGEEGKETVLTGSRSAVAGGFTSVVTMPNTRPANDSALTTELILRRAAVANLCRVLPAGAITKGLKGEELADMAELVQAGCVAITDDGRPVMNASLMRRAMLYSRMFDIPVMAHEEDLSLSQGGAMNEGPTATRLGLLPIPPSAEVAMVARDVVLAEETGARLHIAHLSCEGSVRLVRDAKRRGLRVTAEATPHHFSLDDTAVEGYRTEAKMNPPLRSQADVKAVREGLADGTIDAIATDHAPHGVGDKCVEFDQAANGVIGLETSLALTLELCRRGVLPLMRAIELLTDGPARAFKLAGGHLGVGAPGDVAIIDLEEKWTVAPSDLFSRSHNTPFEGFALTGRVKQTIVAGRLVFDAGRFGESA